MFYILKNLRICVFVLATLPAFANSLPVFAQTASNFRPPAVPLVTHDPYFSVWSMSNRLTDEPTKHWTGANQSMLGMIQIDGKTFRFAGAQPFSTFAGATGASSVVQVPPMTQTALEVLPTRTIYKFEAAGIELQMTFLTPALPDNLDVYSRPVTYLVWDARAVDNKPHAVKLYYDVTAQWVVTIPEQPVTWGRVKIGDTEAVRMGTRDQQILDKSGDNLRIDWGYLYLLAPPQTGASLVVNSNGATRGEFLKNGVLPDSDDSEMPRAPLAVPRSAREQRMPVMAAAFDLGNVTNQTVSRHLLLAYDDIYSIEYFKRRLRPYWRRNGADAGEMLRAAVREYPALKERSRQFDEKLMADLTNAGGADYAKLAALAFRQTVAAHKLTVDFDGTPLYFSKENFSNGCIATVDVTYPSAPFFLVFNPELLRAQITPIMEYARSGRWKFPFAPHDLGTYPLANGQVYGGGEFSEENQMPVEESGNILILMAALAKRDGNADYANKYWNLLEKWAAYLRDKGFDPENQLSTDDFAGHFPHNANLSVKAITALGSYATLAEMTNRKQEAREYRRLAESFAKRWEREANDGDHYRLAFDKAGTWSQKYNLVWDKLLGLNLFSPEVARREIAFYKTKQNAFGLPLDNRETYTKLDWIVWTATLADSKQDFESFVRPLVKFADETPDRVPLTDWFMTTTAKQSGFQARSVVGGVFIKLLAERQLQPIPAVESKSAAAR